jgi:hypothetical protein
MRDPNQLPSVLHSFLGHPDLPELLKDTQTLVAYLDEGGWARLPDEPTTEGEESEEWQTYFKRMEAWERLDSDYGEIMLAVEAKLGELSLLPAQEKTLKAAFKQICPECEDLLHVLIPSRSTTS